MKSILLAAALLMPLPALAQAPSPPPTKLFTAGADIPALIAQAKAAQKSPAVNSVVPLAVVGPYRVLLEYRTGLTPPTIHHGQAELIQVIRGNATLATLRGNEFVQFLKVNDIGLRFLWLWIANVFFSGTVRRRR